MTTPGGLNAESLLWVLLAVGAVLFFAAGGFALYAMIAGARTFRRDRAERNLHASWTPFLLKAMAGEESPLGIARAVKRADAVLFSQFLLQFVRRVRGPERRVLALLGSPFLNDVAQGLRDPRPQRRAQSVYALGLLAPTRFKEAVRAALNDPAVNVAVTAAFVLLAPRSIEDARVVLQKLERFGSWDIGLLSFLLAQVGIGLAPDLRDALEDPGRAVRVRRIAAQTLARLQDPLAGDGAARILSSNEDPELLSAALGILKNWGRTEHADVVRAACASPAFFVRAAALTALGHLGGTADEAFLRDYFDTPNPWIAAHAAEALKKIGALTFLKAVADSDHPRAALARQVLETV